MAGVPNRVTDTQRRRPCDVTGRSWSYADARHEAPRMAGHGPSREGGRSEWVGRLVSVLA